MNNDYTKESNGSSENGFMIAIVLFGLLIVVVATALAIQVMY